jgi:hypothetical protein
MQLQNRPSHSCFGFVNVEAEADGLVKTGAAHAAAPAIPSLRRRSRRDIGAEAIARHHAPAAANAHPAAHGSELHQHGPPA